ncbi:MAG: hypothetical protein AB1346_14080 [Thermodesulfobacteriota bacterium]
MGIRDKELIESRFGPLWSGKTEVVLCGRTRTLLEVKRMFDLAVEDVVAIDLVELPGDVCAFRFYDGDDRCVVVFVFDGEGEIREELRAHVAEWLGDVYHDTGALAFDPEAMVHCLRRRQEEK